MGIVKLPPISEAQFQRQVIQLARLCGWKCAHFRPAMTRSGKWVTPVQADGKGFLDLFMVHRKRRRTIQAEIKVHPNKLTAEQREWYETLLDAGEEAYVWYPEDWPEIERVLRGEG